MAFLGNERFLLLLMIVLLRSSNVGRVVKEMVVSAVFVLFVATLDQVLGVELRD